MTSFMRRPTIPSALVVAVVGLVCLLPVLMLAAVLWPLDEAARSEALQRVLQELSKKPWTGLLKFLVPFAVLVAMSWFMLRVERYGRLTIDGNVMHHDSGVPFFRRWLDWTLALERLRSGDYRLVMRVPPLNPNALQFVTMQWGSGLSIRRLAPHAWVAVGTDGAASTGHLHRSGWSFRLLRKDKAALQANMDALPLVAALRSHGVLLPPLEQASSSVSAGPDLTRLKRMRLAFWVLGVLSLVGLAGLVGLPYEQLVPGPPWVELGQFVALAWLAVALWVMRDASPVALTGKDRSELRVAQVFTGLLVALSGAWALQAALMAWVHARAPTHDVTYVLDHASAQLHPTPPALGDGAVLPVVTTDFASWARWHWARQPNNSQHTLRLRRGLRGLWWQLDLRPLLPAIRKADPMSEAPAPRER